MRVEIRNLGIVKHAKIDVRPLTIFVGPNNAGKTWVANALSAVLGPYGWTQYRRSYALKEISDRYHPLDSAIRQVLEEGNAQINLVEFADKYGEQYFNNVALLARRWMRECLGTDRISFENFEMHIRLDETKAHLLRRTQDTTIEGQLSVGLQREGALLTALKRKDEQILYLYTAAEGRISEKLPIQALEEFVAGSVFQALHRVLFRTVVPFPTERTTFITFSFSAGESGVAEFKTVETQSRDHEVRVLGISVAHFLNLMENAFKHGRLTRNKQAQNEPAIQDYIELAQLLENEILAGSVDFSTPEPSPQRELLFQPTENTKLEMPIVSSMVKELTPLVLYLRYLAQPYEWLIIDEPEMNLHPKAQVQLVEFLAMLTSANLPILITTHSPYVVDHLVNLMKAAQYENQEAIADKFYLKRAEAFIPKEKVSVYLFENGTAKNILDEEGMIDWGTFGDISDQISKLYFEL